MKTLRNEGNLSVVKTLRNEGNLSVVKTLRNEGNLSVVKTLRNEGNLSVVKTLRNEGYIKPPTVCDSEAETMTANPQRILLPHNTPILTSCAHCE